MRFFTPALLLGAAGFLHVHNPTEQGSVLSFPFMGTLLPSTKGDLLAQAHASELILIGAGLLSLAVALFRMFREKSARLD
jgi:hypothetical protein